MRTLPFLLWANGLVGVFAQPAPLPKTETSLYQVRFSTETLTVWSGRTHMVAFHTDTPSPEERLLNAYLEEGQGVLTLLEQPRLQGGQSTGYFRLAALKPGRARIFLDGQKLNIESKPLPHASDAFDGHPEITSPADGSYIWESFHVAVEYHPPPAPFAGPADQPVLILPNGNELKPASLTPEQDGFPIRCLFHVRKQALPEGLSTLLVQNGSGTARLTVHTLKDNPDFFLKGEFENMDPSWSRNKRIGESPPKILKDEKASGNQAINNSSSNPAWSRPIEVPEGGALVQISIRARATPGQGALPTVSAYLDEELQNPIATVRLGSEEWEWVPLGTPTLLKAGTHPLTIYFRNDFNEKNGGDRNLYLDAYAIALLPSLPQPRPGDLKISWENGAQDLSIAESMLVRAKVWLAADLAPTPPIVRLLLNGKIIHEQTGQARPRYLLAPSQLQEGANELHWQAEWKEEAQTLVSETPKRKLFKVADLSDTYIPRQLTFTAQDQAWTDESRKSLSYKGEPHFALLSKQSVAMDLPPSLEGSYKLEIQGRGDSFEGPPEVQASMLVEGNTVPIGKSTFEGGWNFRSTGQVQLPRGPKQLQLTFTNDHFVEKKGDRNVYLSSVQLISTRPKDELPPQVRLVYPPADHTLHGSDAVVAQILENDRLQKIDLLIDGKAQQLNITPGPQGGPVLLPLLLRDLPPGPHQIQVTATDSSGNTATSSPLPVQVLAQRPSHLGPYARAVRLLQRFGYGPEPVLLSRLLTQGESVWMQEQLHAEPSSDYDLASYPNDLDNGHLRARIVRHYLTTPNPVQSRLLNWAENHFSTWERKTGAWHEYQEHRRFAALGDAPFREYLLTSATSPSMLFYLDQQGSFAGKINENYAREILELHSLGVKGGYNQQDVTSLARLLTGWTLSQDAPLAGEGRNLIRTLRFVPKMNDPLDEQKPLPIIGWPFHHTAPEHRADRIRLALDLITDHPSTARYISSKLIHHYHLMPAPEDIEQEITETFTRSGGDLTEVLRHIARHPSFWNPMAKPRLATPMDFSIRLARLVGESNPYLIMDFLGKSGMGLYDRATPDGYPEEDEAYADSNALLQRWRFAQELENRIFNLLPRAWRYPREGETEEAYLTRVIDCYAYRLTGGLLSERSQKATLVLAQTSKLQKEDRLKLIGVFICQLPEASLR